MMMKREILKCTSSEINKGNSAFGSYRQYILCFEAAKATMRPHSATEPSRTENQKYIHLSKTPSVYPEPAKIPRLATASFVKK